MKYSITQLEENMFYDFRTMFRSKLNNNGKEFKFCLHLKWTYDGYESNNARWKDQVRMKDYLQETYGLNRGYQFLVDDQWELNTYLWFDAHDKMLLFKLRF